jgi:hypothetical protein
MLQVYADIHQPTVHKTKDSTNTIHYVEEIMGRAATRMVSGNVCTGV